MKCPECLTETTISKKDKRSSQMVCDHCGADIEDHEANKLMGVEHVGDGYQSIGDNYTKFPSWFCLKLFETYDERIEHDKRYHKRDDPALGMVPSGISSEIVIRCGD